MKKDVENIFLYLPFDNSIKMNIYAQLYKSHKFISTSLKKDIMTYPTFVQVKDTYLQNKQNEETDHDCMYRLFNDMASYMYTCLRTSNHENEDVDSLIQPFSFQLYSDIMNVNLSRASIESLEIRAKKIWQNMTLEQKINFKPFNKN